MAYLADKRYKKIEFTPGKWTKVIGEHGEVTWTSSDPAASCTITEIDGNLQTHNNCPTGSTITTTGGTASSPTCR